MRILFLTQYFPPEVGAAQVRLANVTRALGELGHDVRVVTGLPNYPTGKVFDDYRWFRRRREVVGRMRVRRTWLVPVQSGGLTRLLSYATFQLSSFFPTVWLCLRWKPDYLFIESPPLFLGLTGMAARWLTGTKFIFNVADLWPDVAVELGVISRRSWMYRMASRIEKWSYSASHRITVVVEYMAETLRAKGIAREKILFLPNGVDTEMFAPREPNTESPSARSLVREANGRRIVLYAGTHGKVHSLTLALDAAALMTSRPDVLFVFVGDGTEKPRLATYAQQLGLTNVVFIDPVPVEEVAELFRLADVALSISIVSARPAKIFPAMASATPIVHAGRGEGADVLQQAESAVILDAGDPQALAEAILRLIDDPELATTLGRSGRQFVVDHYSWTQICREWVTELEHAERP